MKWFRSNFFKKIKFWCNWLPLGFFDILFGLTIFLYPFIAHYTGKHPAIDLGTLGADDLLRVSMAVSIPLALWRLPIPFYGDWWAWVLAVVTSFFYVYWGETYISVWLERTKGFHYALCALIAGAWYFVISLALKYRELMVGYDSFCKELDLKDLEFRNKKALKDIEELRKILLDHVLKR